MQADIRTLNSLKEDFFKASTRRSVFNIYMSINRLLCEMHDNMDFDQLLIILHILNELCYNVEHRVAKGATSTFWKELRHRFKLLKQQMRE